MLCLALLLARPGYPLALVFSVVGLWKFGFAETLICIISALNTAKSPLSRIVGLMDGFGTLAHHTGTMLAVIVFVLGLSRLTRTIFSITTPLLVQHMFTSLRYYSVPMFAIIQLALEIFWELEVFANFEYPYIPYVQPQAAGMPYPMYNSMLPRAVCCMLLAHWMYWGAAILSGIEKVIEARRLVDSSEEGTGAVDSSEEVTVVNSSSYTRTSSVQMVAKKSSMTDWHMQVHRMSS